MPWFEYEGLTPGGTAIAGKVEAINREQACVDLAKMRIEVRELRGATASPKRPAGLTEDDLVFFNEQVASLAEAGIALDEGLAQLARDISSPRLRKWVQALVEDLRRGIPIDKAIEARESGLPILYSRVIRAGIESGQLAATLLNLNYHLRITGNTRRMLWEMATYPLVVALLAVTVVSGIFLFVIPHFKSIYIDFGTALPGMTVMLINISEHFPIILLIAAVTIAAIGVIWHSLRFMSPGRRIRESIIFLIPVVGRIYKASLISRFLRSVSTTVATGIPMPEAMRLGAGASGSALLANDAERLAKEVEQGQSLFEANKQARLIPPLFGYCVQVAAGRDDLPESIGKLARSYENRAIHAQAMLRVVFFPLMILFVGFLMAYIIIGLFLPLIHLVNAVSG